MSMGVTISSPPPRECYLKTRRRKGVVTIFFLVMLVLIIRKGSQGQIVLPCTSLSGVGCWEGGALFANCAKCGVWAVIA